METQYYRQEGVVQPSILKNRLDEDKGERGRSVDLAIISASRLFCEGLRKLVEDDDEIRIVGMPGMKADLLEVMKLRPQVILIDHNALYAFPRQYLNGETAKFILIDSRAQPSLFDGEVIELISRGVIVGILSSDTSGELLKKAIKLVAAGELWLGHLAIKNILTHTTMFKQNLTKQESQIANLVCRGLCNKEIAQELNIAEATVKSHLNRLFRKCNVSGRLQLGLKLRAMV